MSSGIILDCHPYKELTNMLVEGLLIQQSDAEYNAVLDATIQSIYEAPTLELALVRNRVSALLRPDIFRAVVLLSVPYLQRSWAYIRPTELMKQMAGDKQFYQLYFQEPGKAEHEFEADVRKTMLMGLYSGSGDAPRRQVFHQGGDFHFSESSQLKE